MSRWDEAFDKPAPRNGTQAGVAPVIAINGQAHAYALAALQGEVTEVAGAPEGRRNATLNKAAIRMGRHIGAGTITLEQVREALFNAARATGLDDDEIDRVLRTDKDNGGLIRGQAEPRHPTELETPAVTVIDVPDLTAEQDDAFWGARPVLRHLHTFARARLVSPWAVLGVTLARVITATPNQVCLPPIIGARQSLNMFVGLVGTSGSGKGAAEAVAAEALDVGHIVSHNVGSGEGIAHGYKHRLKGELVWNDEDHAVLFSVPEIDSLAAQGDRRGATLMPQLRSGWTGEQLGFGYADPTKRIIVEAHQYRLCLIAGIQPARAACLLNDADGGTPQRFLWLPATDRDAPDQEPAEPQVQVWTAPPVSKLVTFGGIKIDVCETARQVIRVNRKLRNKGDGHALDGHALLAQLKTAAALGIMDGRYVVNDEDWALADVVARKSAATRADVVRVLSDKLTQANAGRAEAEAKRAVLVADTVADAAVKRVCGLVMRKLRKTADWTPRAVLTRAAGRDITYLEDALERLLDAGQIDMDEAGRGTKYKATEVKA